MALGKEQHQRAPGNSFIPPLENQLGNPRFGLICTKDGAVLRASRCRRDLVSRWPREKASEICGELLIERVKDTLRGGMDRRGFGIIGAIIAMVIAGLVVYAIVYYGPSVWHGIHQGAPSGGSVLSADEVKQHPEKYLGETVTVEGWYVPALWSNLAPYDEISPIDPSQISTPGDAATIMTGGLPVNVPANITVFSTAKYRFTGVVVSAQLWGQTLPRLDVTSVEPV